MKHGGELSALLTAIFWTVTALAFEASSKRIGSMVVNLFRLIAGFIFLTLFAWVYRGLIFPVDATSRAWFYLIISGLIGFSFGDLCLFQAFVVIGARISMLLMALAPPLTALISWIVLGETMTIKSWIGMALTMNGVTMVVLTREGSKEKLNIFRQLKFKYPFWGILLGLGAAVGQAVGLVLSKYGMRGYNAFASAQIRILAGIAGFILAFFIFGQWKKAYRSLSNHKALVQLSVGAFFGPFLGVSFSLLAIQMTSTGIASTIMAIVPVLIILPSVILFKEKVTVKEITGAILAVAGVGIFFL